MREWREGEIEGNGGERSAGCGRRQRHKPGAVQADIRRRPLAEVNLTTTVEPTEIVRPTPSHSRPPERTSEKA
jgi:hypothetical protein